MLNLASMYAVCKLPGQWKCVKTGRKISPCPKENELVKIRSAVLVAGHTFYEIEGYGGIDNNVLYHSHSFQPLEGTLLIIKNIDICLN